MEIPDPRKVPLYGPAPKTVYGIPLDVMDNLRNRDYYRDIATYIRDRSLLCPVGIAVTNASPTVADEVWLTLEFNTAEAFVILEKVPSLASLQRTRSLCG